MIEKFRVLGIAAALIAGPAIAGMASTTVTTTTPSGTVVQQAPSPSYGTTQQEQAENSVSQHNAWEAQHPGEAARGSSDQRSGIAGGGGPGGGDSGGGGSAGGR